MIYKAFDLNFGLRISVLGSRKISYIKDLMIIMISSSFKV